jgi:serine/threonine-protein kinase
VGVAKILATADERSSPMPELPGYAIVGKIGKGGKANVYHAIRKSDNLPVAVKILLGKTISKPRALDLFRREIEITKQLSHPNIIEYIEDGTADGAPYLVLEYADSGSLDEFIYEHPERKLGFVEAKPIMFQVLEALAFIHHQGLVHRDIKPKNILFKTGRDGMLTAKVSDLGLAGRIALGVSRDAVPSLVGEGGTPAYMPPEQLLEINRVLPQSDVFSAAATFYQMLTGATLYKFGTDPKDRASTIIDGEITPILQLRPDLPSGLADVISKGLAYYPEHRYADGQEMLEAMRHVME